jgi:hypothetical protein
MMAGRGKLFELLDILKFAAPSVGSIDAALTALPLRDRLGGGGFMSYGQMWPRMEILVSGLATDQFIETTFASYKDEWKNNSIREAFRLLRDQFGGKGTWYRRPTPASYVLGIWFKPSIKGIWYHNSQAYAVLINARKGQPLRDSDVKMLARGIYELHCINDPADPTPLIVDLSQHREDEQRRGRIYAVPVADAVPLETFEYTVREFLSALNIAGVALPPPPETEHILDLFRR